MLSCKRKSIQRESCRWRRDREGSASVRETGTKTQSSKRTALSRLTLEEAALAWVMLALRRPVQEPKKVTLGKPERRWGLRNLPLGSNTCSRTSVIFSQKALFYTARCDLYMKILLKNNKTLICCTVFPTLGFSRDDCPKIIVIVIVFVPIFYSHLLSAMF